MSFNKRARIIGLGSYLPEKILTNQELETMVDTSEEWILSRTGIKERRIAHSNEFASDMGTNAAKIALKNSNYASDQIDLILVATLTPDYIAPSTAAIIQHQLGATKAAAFDIQAACTGYIYGLSVAKAYIESGMYNNILLIATEKMSTYVDYQDRNTCVLFGDGASAAIITAEGEGLAIDSICLGTDGSLSELLYIPAGGTRHPATEETLSKRQHYFKMVGKEVFRHAVRRMENSARDCLEKSGLTSENISWLVPHQANARIIDAVAKSFNFPDELVFRTVHKYGNTSASSIAIALDELIQNNSITDGQHILLVAFGAGFTWGASILTKI